MVGKNECAGRERAAGRLASLIDILKFRPTSEPACPTIRPHPAHQPQHARDTVVAEHLRRYTKGMAGPRRGVFQYLSFHPPP